MPQILDKKEIQKFQKIIWNYAKDNSRRFAWRKTTNAYRILVSEIMLQQTQTTRVEEKYKEFLKKFPTVKLLANSSPAEVITIWSGLGYNRRALFLHRAAQIIMQKYAGRIPDTIESLQSLPGVGYATAAAILVAAYGKKIAYMETNIRSVYLHYFFPNKTKVSDKAILPFIEATLPSKALVRSWYNALMDYGVMLKKNGINPSRNSRHYLKQSTFIGSDRQLRGQILRLLSRHRTATIHVFCKELHFDHLRIESMLHQLEQEFFIEQKGKSWRLRQN